MNRVSTEVLLQILQQCDFSSQKNARLVNAGFNLESTPLVFNHFYMGFFRYGLINLFALARSPLSRHVRKFTIYSDMLKPRPMWIDAGLEQNVLVANRGSEPVLRSGLVLRTDETSSSHDHNVATLNDPFDLCDYSVQQAWLRYEACCREQLDWRENGAGLMLKESFAFLPNLCHAEVRYTAYCRRKDRRLEDMPVWKGFRHSILAGPVGEWLFDNDMLLDHSGPAALHLLEAMSFRHSFFGTKPITKLVIRTDHCPLPSRMLPAISWTGDNGNTMLQNISYHDAVAHLVELRLEAPHTSDSLHDLSFTPEFLRSAKNLRRLYLAEGFPGDRDGVHESHSSFCWNRFFLESEKVIWPSLQHLCLSANATCEALLHFSELHSITLKSLKLWQMYVVDLERLIKEISQMPELEQVSMESLYPLSSDGSDVGTPISYQYSKKNT